MSESRMSGQRIFSWIVGAGLTLGLAAWTCPARAQQGQPQQSQAQQNQAQQNSSQPGQQGDWGPAGPPPDVENGQIPAPPAGEQPEAGAPPPAQAPAAQPAPSATPNPAPPENENQARPPYRGESSNPGYESRQPTYPAQQPQYPATPAGPVTVPAGTTLQVRTAQPLDTKHLQAGDYFQATLARSVYSGSVLAIPRGAELTGRVVDVKKAGELQGSSGLALQITSLTLGGQTYPLATGTWSMKGPGKGGYTASTTVGAAVLGAMIGAIAGGGPGAAIGAAAGTGAGLGASAATPGPRGAIPPEAMLSFRLSHPVTVQPVSYEEAQRLQQNSAPPQRPYPAPARQRYYGYPPPPPPYYPYAYATPYPYPYAYGYPYPYRYPYPYYYRYWR